jgi:hypothetical protein
MKSFAFKNDQATGKLAILPDLTLVASIPAYHNNLWFQVILRQDPIIRFCPGIATRFVSSLQQLFLHGIGGSPVHQSRYLCAQE